MIFNIDPDVILSSITEALNEQAIEMSDDMQAKVVETLNNALPGVMQILGQNISEYWKMRARAASGWGGKYASAIKYTADDNSAEIFVDEKSKDQGSNKPNIMFVKMMEEGVKSWSIKDALLKSKKAKAGKDGVRYITVPFPVATPQKKGQGQQKSYFGGRTMTSKIYNLVKSGGKVPLGTTLMAGSREVNISGLTQYNTRQLHGQYGIFRRVSEHSKGWRFPNTPPTPVYPSVLREVNKQISEVLKNFCQALVKEFSE